MEIMMGSALGLQIVNIILLALLISVYARNLAKVRSNFTVGLLIFAGFLLLQNLFGIFFGIGLAESMTGPVENYVFAINITETIALLALFWISWK